MAVLEWPGDIYHAMCEVLNGSDPITLERKYNESFDALMGMANG